MSPSERRLNHMRVVGGPNGPRVGAISNVHRPLLQVYQYLVGGHWQGVVSRSNSSPTDCFRKVWYNSRAGIPHMGESAEQTKAIDAARLP